LSQPEAVLSEKRALRESMRERRQAVVAARGPELAAVLATRGIAFLDPAPGTIVSAFCSMPGELDTGPLLARLHADGFRLCLPVMQGRGKPLLFRAWQPHDDMEVVTWGIREPKAGQPLLRPRIVLVPLLAFDLRGWRLGYGGGFFDRTLRMLRSDGEVSAVGLALDELEVDAVPHLDYDERLDWVLTPSRAMRCSD